MSFQAHNLPSAFPVWSNKNSQTHKQFYCKGWESLAAIKVRYDRMSPIVIMGPTADPTKVWLREQDFDTNLDAEQLDITTLLGAWEISDENGKDYVKYYGDTDLAQGTAVPRYTAEGAILTSQTWAQFVDCSKYYTIHFDFPSGQYYSELIRFLDFPEFSTDASDEHLVHIRLRARSTCTIGDIPTGTENRLFFNGYVYAGEYLINDVVQTGGDEEDTPLWIKVKKRYAIKLYAIESVVDFLATVPAYGTIELSDQYGHNTAIRDVEVKPVLSEEFGECFYEVDFSFTKDYIDTNGCCPE